jgi:hypothetical protein
MDDLDDDYEDDEDYEPLPVVAPENRTMDTPANSAPDPYEASLMQTWDAQGGADRNADQMLANATRLIEHTTGDFESSYQQLSPGAASAFEEQMAISPRPARLNGSGELALGGVSAALAGMMQNERVSREDRAELRAFLEGLNNQDEQAILDWFSGMMR